MGDFSSAKLQIAETIKQNASDAMRICGYPFASGFKLDNDPRPKDAPFINPAVANTLAPILRLPYIQQWSLTVERSLTANDVVELSYVGTKGTRLSLAADYNQCRLPDCPKGLSPDEVFRFDREQAARRNSNLAEASDEAVRAFLASGKSVL